MNSLCQASSRGLDTVSSSNCAVNLRRISICFQPSRARNLIMKHCARKSAFSPPKSGPAVRILNAPDGQLVAYSSHHTTPPKRRPAITNITRSLQKLFFIFDPNSHFWQIFGDHWIHNVQYDFCNVGLKHNNNFCLRY